MLLAEIDRLAASRADFALESTLSGLGYLSQLKEWKEQGYRIEIIYLTLPSPEAALRRIDVRVQQGGHEIPKADVVRRFERSWKNFQEVYKSIADAWIVYDNSGDEPQLTAQGHEEIKTIPRKPEIL